MPTLRILHLADIHLGIENYGRPDPESGFSTRLGDFLKSLNRAIDWALENDVHLVLIAGDIFKNRDPTPTVQREFAKCVNRLSKAGLPTFIIVGNHDVPNAWKRAHSVEIYSTLEVPGVTITSKPGLHVIDTRVGRVQIVALPWLSRAFVMSQGDYRNLDAEDLNREMVSLVENFIDSAAEKLDPDLPALLVAHVSVQGAVYSSERNIMLGQDVVIPKAIIADRRFDYVALGHIHKFQVLNHGRPLVIYPGSMERIDFGEERDKKGFVTVEIDERDENGEREVRYTFHESGARPFVTIKVDADVEMPTEEVLRRINEHADEARDAIVRLIIDTTPERERDLRMDEIRRAMNATGASFYSLSTNVARRNRMLLGEHGVEQMNPEEALRVYLQNKGTGAQRTEELVKYYRQLSGALVESERPASSE